MRKRDELASPWWLLPPGRIRPLWWVAVAAGLIWSEYIGGPGSQFPVLYVIPVALAAWYSGRWSAVSLAVAVPAAHLLFLVIGPARPAGLEALLVPIATTLFRGAVIFVMALWFARLSEHERALHRRVEQLEGLLPICSFCKSIRNTSGDWETLETYISTRSEAEFSHGFCGECGKTHYPELVPGLNAGAGTDLRYLFTPRTRAANWST